MPFLQGPLTLVLGPIWRVLEAGAVDSPNPMTVSHTPVGAQASSQGVFRTLLSRLQVVQPPFFLHSHQGGGQRCAPPKQGWEEGNTRLALSLRAEVAAPLGWVLRREGRPYPAPLRVRARAQDGSTSEQPDPTLDPFLPGTQLSFLPSSTTLAPTFLFFHPSPTVSPLVSSS